MRTGILLPAFDLTSEAKAEEIGAAIAASSLSAVGLQIFPEHPWNARMRTTLLRLLATKPIEVVGIVLPDGLKLRQDEGALRPLCDQVASTIRYYSDCLALKRVFVTVRNQSDANTLAIILESSRETEFLTCGAQAIAFESAASLGVDPAPVIDFSSPLPTLGSWPSRTIPVGIYMGSGNGAEPAQNFLQTIQRGGFTDAFIWSWANTHFGGYSQTLLDFSHNQIESTQTVRPANLSGQVLSPVSILTHPSLAHGKVLGTLDSGPVEIVELVKNPKSGDVYARLADGTYIAAEIRNHKYIKWESNYGHSGI